MKPWMKATEEGKLYWDMSHPEFKKWFASEIKRLQKSKLYQQIKSLTTDI